MKKLLPLTVAGLTLALLVPTTFAAGRRANLNGEGSEARPMIGTHVSRRTLHNEVTRLRAPLLRRGTRGVERAVESSSSSVSSSSASSVSSSASSETSSSASSK